MFGRQAGGLPISPGFPVFIHGEQDAKTAGSYSLFLSTKHVFLLFQFIYLRELDLEKINRGTVVELANHPNLKKVTLAFSHA